MSEVAIMGNDPAKRVFQLHGARIDGPAVFLQKLSRCQVFGHSIRLIPPIHVRPFASGRKMLVRKTVAPVAPRRPTHDARPLAMWRCAPPFGLSP